MEQWRCWEREFKLPERGQKIIIISSLWQFAVFLFEVKMSLGPSTFIFLLHVDDLWIWMANMLEPWTAPQTIVIPGHSAEPSGGKLLSWLISQEAKITALPALSPPTAPTSPPSLLFIRFLSNHITFDMDFHLCMKCTIVICFPTRLSSMWERYPCSFI